MPYRVKCPKLNRTIDVSLHKNLMWELKRNEIPIASSCRGNGACKWCRIQICSGMEHISERTRFEIQSDLSENERLSCQIQIDGDIEISTTYW